MTNKASTISLPVQVQGISTKNYRLYLKNILNKNTKTNTNTFLKTKKEKNYTLFKQSMLTVNEQFYTGMFLSMMAFLIGTYLTILPLIYWLLEYILELPEGSFRHVHRAAPYVSETTL